MSFWTLAVRKQKGTIIIIIEKEKAFMMQNLVSELWLEER